MSESLGTRDVLEQVDARLGNVEQDLRDLHAEVHQGFASVRAEVQQLGNRLDARLDGTTRWLVGLMLLSWLSLMASIWLRS